MGRRDYIRFGQKWIEREKNMIRNNERLIGERNRKVDEIDRLEKRIQQLYGWIDSHIKKLKASRENTETYEYSERRIKEIVEEIENLELRKSYLEEEIDEFRDVVYEE